MQNDNINPQQPSQSPIVAINDKDLIRQLMESNIQLRETIDKLANTLALQIELIQQLRDEIANLKGQKPKPKIRPSKLEGQNRKPDWHKRIGPHDNQRKTVLFSTWVRDFESHDLPFIRWFFSAITTAIHSFQNQALNISSLAKRMIKMVRRIGKPGQPKGKPRKKKKTLLQIHDEVVIQPENIPDGAEFKGFKPFTVQDIIFQSYNTKYRIAQWQLPDGTYIRGQLPKSIHGHYGPELVTYILHQYHACRVTQHLLLEQLRACGVLISAGQLNNILIENKTSFVEEVKELLPIAAEVEKQVQTDDTGGRHKGKNQYTTIIGNRWFSVFTTTDSKSRINFLKLLQGGKDDYLINDDTIDYLRLMNVPDYLSGYINLWLESKFTTLGDWEQFLKERNIIQKVEMRFLTEAALYASVIQNGIPRNLGVHSDDAGQFDVFIRSLCWIHEERHYRKLIMTTDDARADLDRVIDQIWTIYQALKTYKENPDEIFIEIIENQFDDIFQQNTSSPTLNHRLEKTYKKKEDLLRVLQRHETPLHNNSSESCARSAKIKLKISGGTRSDLGQKARDTFLSLKQTCLKLSINFMDFLRDRVHGLDEIPRLAIVIRQRAMAATLALATDPCA